MQCEKKSVLNAVSKNNLHFTQCSTKFVHTLTILFPLIAQIALFSTVSGLIKLPNTRRKIVDCVEVGHKYHNFEPVAQWCNLLGFLS